MRGTPYTYRDDDSRPFIAVSPDEKWLYVVGSGRISNEKKKRENGKVYVLDAKAGKLAATYDIGYIPRKPVVDTQGNAVMVTSAGPAGQGAGKLYRFTGKEPPETTDLGESPQFIRIVEGMQGLWAVGWDEMTFLPREGATASYKTIVLNKSSLYKGLKLPLTLGGPPSPGMVYLPKYNKMLLGIDDVLVDSGEFVPTDKIALVDLKDGRIDQVIKVGRGGIKAAKFAAKLGLSIGMSMAVGMASYSPRPR